MGRSYVSRRTSLFGIVNIKRKGNFLMAKGIWGVIGLLGLGVIVFNNYNQSVDLLAGNNKQVIALLSSLIVVMIYGIKNKKEIFK